MSTFLELCKRTRQECGIAGDGPTSVVSQVGIMKKVVDRTARAWVDIQAGCPTWKFQRNQIGPFSLTIGTREYSVVNDLLLTSVDKWDKQSSFIYETSTEDETKLDWITYEEYRNRYRTYPPGRPEKIYEGLNGKIGFERSPDKAYKITLDYRMTPELMANNSDVPALPEQYHDVIVWASVMMFGGAEVAPELFNYAKMMYAKKYFALWLDQAEAPTANKSYPIATNTTGVRR